MFNLFLVKSLEAYLPSYIKVGVVYPEEIYWKFLIKEALIRNRETIKKVDFQYNYA
jgi:hypothetical protein